MCLWCSSRSVATDAITPRPGSPPHSPKLLLEVGMLLPRSYRADTGVKKGRRPRLPSPWARPDRSSGAKASRAEASRPTTAGGSRDPSQLRLARTGKVFSGELDHNRRTRKSLCFLRIAHVQPRRARFASLPHARKPGDGALWRLVDHAGRPVSTRLVDDVRRCLPVAPRRCMARGQASPNRAVCSDCDPAFSAWPAISSLAHASSKRETVSIASRIRVRLRAVVRWIGASLKSCRPEPAEVPEILPERSVKDRGK